MVGFLCCTLLDVLIYEILMVWQFLTRIYSKIKFFVPSSLEYHKKCNGRWDGPKSDLSENLHSVLRSQTSLRVDMTSVPGSNASRFHFPFIWSLQESLFLKKNRILKMPPIIMWCVQLCLLHRLAHTHVCNKDHLHGRAGFKLCLQR
jgi:hypothetical protein